VLERGSARIKVAGFFKNCCSIERGVPGDSYSCARDIE